MRIAWGIPCFHYAYDLFQLTWLILIKATFNYFLVLIDRQTTF